MTKNTPTEATHAASTDRSRNIPMNIIPHSDKSFNPAMDIFEWVKRRRGIK